MAMHTGSCGCGQIRITAGCDPQTVSSTYSVHAYFPTKHVRVKGTTKVYARRGDSGAYVYFHFCPECGTIIYWEIEARRGKTALGTIRLVVGAEEFGSRRRVERGA